jgi:type I restriction enzyme M protein
MLTGEIRSQVGSILNDFWSFGVSNQLSVIEQITYLLFIKRLDQPWTIMSIGLRDWAHRF